ncbi:MAG: hypothetical protein APF77_11140 [Clostridia bacterium BRH_c25]|nr:MAG: hypothetical protein APF77_11140 [Clostridia bacterium BRH_c25]
MNNMKDCLQNDLKALICKLPDIMNCSVVCDEAGNIEEIHVLAAVGKNIKQIVRDIQSAINAKFNISVDYKKVSIAQINEAEFKEARVRIESIAVKNVDNMIEATVVLSYDDKVYEGKSSKVKSRSNRAKAVAEATLAALEAYMGISGILYLEGLESLKLSGKEVYVSLVGFSQDNIEESLSGCSIISLDENESAVKAVLAAVNRKMNTVA